MVHTHTHTHTHRHARAHAHTHIHRQLHAHTQAFTQACTYAYAGSYTYTHIGHARKHKRLHTDACAHAYTHTDRTHIVRDYTSFHSNLWDQTRHIGTQTCLFKVNSVTGSVDILLPIWNIKILIFKMFAIRWEGYVGLPMCREVSRVKIFRSKH